MHVATRFLLSRVRKIQSGRSTLIILDWNKYTEATWQEAYLTHSDLNIVAQEIKKIQQGVDSGTFNQAFGSLEQKIRQRY